MGDSVRLFSIHSNDYAQFRPTYPDSLFSWLAKQCRQARVALDVAAGNGQATVPLLGHYDNVLACDASHLQLASGTDWRSVHRFTARAEHLPLRNGLADLMVVAQALHWFATPAFFAEAKRILAPDGLFCAWCYSLLRIEPAMDVVIARLHGETLRGYWPQGRASVDAGYRDILAPFETIAVPDFAIEADWNLPQLVGYLRTWSAVRQWQQVYGEDPVTRLELELAQLWGDPQQQRRIRWPLHFLAGYPGR